MWPYLCVHAAGKQGLVIVDVERPKRCYSIKVYDADGQINDARGVKVGFTNASLLSTWPMA